MRHKGKMIKVEEGDERGERGREEIERELGLLELSARG